MTVENKELELIWGVKGIAAVIDRTERQTFHLCANGQLPVKKIGGRWVAEMTRLRAAFTEAAQ